MQGPELKRKIRENNLNLPKNASVADFEVLYSLILEARGVQSPGDITRADEIIVLGSLCRLPIPGKKSEFKNGICAWLSNYRGISSSEKLRRKFKGRLSSRIKTANISGETPTEKELPLRRVRWVFKRR
jgi:hypothetical protein